MTIDQILEKLSRFGAVTLTQFGRDSNTLSGMWWARISLYQETPGANFEIRGDHCGNPNSACQDLMTKVREAFRQRAEHVKQLEDVL